jgi:YHS domain
MRPLRIGLMMVLVVAAARAGAVEDKPAPRSARAALRAFNGLIGSWRATGTPEGTRAEKQRGFWTESMNWEWQFKGKDAWLKVDFDKGKHFAKGELRYLPDKDQYQFTVQTTAKESLSFSGPLQERRLVLDRVDENKKETQRLVITLLHANRFLYRYEVKAQDKPLFTQLYQVGATKEGVPFATAGSAAPECIVSGGLGTMPVTYKGQTYYVCCSGCRDAFKDEPEKYIKEYEEAKAKKAQGQ